MEYVGEASGDVLFTATVDSFSDNVLLEDCIAYKLEEASLTNSNQEINNPIGLEWEAEAFEATFDLYRSGNAISFVINNSTNATNIGVSRYDDSYIWGNFCSGASSKSIPNGAWSTVKVIISPTLFKFTVNEQIGKECISIPTYNEDWAFNLRAWISSSIIKVKNIKIKPVA